MYTDSFNVARRSHGKYEHAWDKNESVPVCVVATSQLGIIPKVPDDVRDQAHYQRLFQAADIDLYVR